MDYSWQPFFPYNAILCRYSEIGTKGRNRFIFEERLRTDLQRRLAALGNLHFSNDRGRIFILPEAPKTIFTAADLALLRREIPLLAGLASVSPGFYVKPDIGGIEQVIDTHFPALYHAFQKCPHALPPTYAMHSRRSDKSFPMSCEEVEIHFATRLHQRFPDLTIDLQHAHLVIELEIRKNMAFISFERIEGPGGLPSGSAGRVLGLLSGGFDSPVACYQMLRRGCCMDFLTFHSSPFTPPATLTKVCALVRRLNDFQTSGKLLTINLLPAQKAIRDACFSRFRTVLYRRFMLRLAEYVAGYLRAQALVTGDNLGQVASQTLENLTVINAATSMLIIRPLITADKNDTMALAEKIGTWKLSSENVPDSCTVFAPPDPATRTNLKKILQQERLIPIDLLLKQCLETTSILNPNDYSQQIVATDKMIAYGCSSQK
ncbi:MAG: tRNA 4-thiouridine(8) synthase ThiI [Lentisphaeria bacterium]|nr:tRNA 4-thiouridine(8) synthase ThiI [Lentisphaeria bacterium]